MQLKLELLAPARNKEIGTAAIDCGADAVYMAGPAFGARVAAANPVGELAALSEYAHRYGAKVFATLNTLLEDDELLQAERLIKEYYDAGVDALIVQDLRILSLDLPPIPLHASTQSVIRTPEDAVRLESFGFSRLILERQLSLESIRAIREAVKCELEFFVHGALCVSYSGECYLSQEITGRSANRGCCAQPCRSRYDLLDADGNLIVRDRPLLSLKDYRLDDHIASLAACGISSFKIEGRLKNASYVKNIVRHYRSVIDSLIEENKQYSHASFGRVEGGFSPDPDLTFNRGYTSCFIDGERGKWNSRDAAKSLGEYIGTISSVDKRYITVDGNRPLANGDGLSFVGRGDDAVGMRADVVEGRRVMLKQTDGLSKGMKVFRNMNLRFERELERNMPSRLIDITVDYESSGGISAFTATAPDGRKVVRSFEDSFDKAESGGKALEMLGRQIGKVTAPYRFSLGNIAADTVRFYPVSFLNGIRRDLAGQLAQLPYIREKSEHKALKELPSQASTLGIKSELMRTKYCIRYELGICPKQHPERLEKEPLVLRNQNRSFRLSFDCKNCEMIVISGRTIEKK